MTFLQPPELPRILTLLVVEVVEEIQPWEEEYSLMIWLPESIPLLKLAIRGAPLEEAQLFPRWKHQFP